MQTTEYAHCRALMNYARIKNWLIFHISNEGKRGPYVSRDMGILRGVSDYYMPIARGGLHGAWVELKRPGGKPSRSQEVFLELMRRYGYAAGWFDSWEKAKDWLEAYLAKP